MKSSNTFVKVFHIVSFIAAIAGIVFYFALKSFSPWKAIVIICGVLVVMDTGYRYGIASRYIFETVYLVIGIIVAVIFHLPFWPTLALAECIGFFISRIRDLMLIKY